MTPRSTRPHSPARDGKQSRNDLVDVTQLVSYRTLQLSNTLGRWAAREYKARFDITLPEWRLISAVGVHGPISVNAVARTIILDKALVSRTLSGLVERKIIAKWADPEHGRRALLALTAHGRSVHAKVSVAALERQSALLSALDAAERRALGTLLAKLQAQADLLLER